MGLAHETRMLPIYKRLSKSQLNKCLSPSFYILFRISFFLNLIIKINHFPGSFQIGRKDRLSRNLYHAQAMFGKNEYNFVPMTFVLPADYGLLKTEVDSKNNTKWILKPVSNKNSHSDLQF